MYTPTGAYRSQPLVPQRHMGSFNLGVSPNHRFSNIYDGTPMAQSRIVSTPHGGITPSNLPNPLIASNSQFVQPLQNISNQQQNSAYHNGYYNQSMKQIGGQQSQVGMNPNLTHSQVTQQQVQYGGAGGNSGPSGRVGDQSGVNGGIDINNTANFENHNQRRYDDQYKGGERYDERYGSGERYRSGERYGSGDRYGGSGGYQRHYSDYGDRDYDQEFAQTKRRNQGKGSDMYAYDDYDRDTRVRKPLDAEHEQKILKLKNEKTKRELHVQELDYKIHILEQENQSLRNQMDQMKTDYKRLNQVFEEKYRHEIERLHLENQDYENSNKQWASRFKDLNSKCDDLVHDKSDLEEENRKLNDKILKIQVLLHEQPIKNQMKYEGSNKNY